MKGTALEGLAPIITLCAAGAAPPACALNPIAPIEVVNEVDVGAVEIPVPLKLTLSRVPLLRVNVSIPLYDWAAAGLNVTNAVKL